MVEGYCAACGQRAAPFLRPVHHLGREVVADYFGFDGKLWRTIVPLLFRPGFLTREYLDGRRNRYVRPVRLYLTASVLLFFLLSVLPEGGLMSNVVRMGPEASAAAADSIAAAKAALADSLGPAAVALSEVEEEIANLDEERAALTASRDSLRVVVAAGENLGGTDSTEDQDFWDAVGETTYSKAERVAGMGEEGARKWVLEAFTSNMPKAMFVLLPLFALLLKLLFVRHGRYYGEHLVFALHTHAFAFVTFALLAALQAVTGSVEQLTGPLRWLVGGSVLMLLASVPAYVLVALHRVYEQGWVKTTLKWAVLTGTYVVALILAVVAVIVLAFLLL